MVTEVLTKKKSVKKKARKKQKSALPAKIVQDVSEVEETSEDFLQETAHKIENLDLGKAVTLIKDLATNAGFNDFQLGGALSVIRSNSWFVEGGYDTFKEFLDGEMGMKYRKAMYLIGIYESLIESGVKWGQVSHLGWTKLKELAPVLQDDNVDELVKLASDMTVLQLQSHLKGLLREESGDDLVGAATEEVSTMTFRVHSEQREIIEEALAKAKEQAATDVNTVALELVCLDFLAGGERAPVAAPPVKPFKESMSEIHWEEVLNIFAELHPTVHIEATVEEEAPE